MHGLVSKSPIKSTKTPTPLQPSKEQRSPNPQKISFLKCGFVRSPNLACKLCWWLSLCQTLVNVSKFTWPQVDVNRCAYTSLRQRVTNKLTCRPESHSDSIQSVHRPFLSDSVQFAHRTHRPFPKLLGCANNIVLVLSEQNLPTPNSKTVFNGRHASFAHTAQTSHSLTSRRHTVQPRTFQLNPVDGLDNQWSADQIPTRLLVIRPSRSTRWGRRTGVEMPAAVAPSMCWAPVSARAIRGATWVKQIPVEWVAASAELFLQQMTAT